MKNRFINIQRGSTLVEVLVAIGVLSVVLTALMAMMGMSVRLSERNEKRQLALQKANETIEFFKKERLLNSWPIFSDSLSENNYCFPGLPDEISLLPDYAGSCQATETLEVAQYKFTRQLSVSHLDASTISMQVSLNWYELGEVKSLSLEQEFKEY